MAIVVKATFTGRDASLGYRQLEEYELYIVRNKISLPYGGGECPYGSVEAFLKNWDNVNVPPGQLGDWQRDLVRS